MKESGDNDTDSTRKESNETDNSRNDELVRKHSAVIMGVVLEEFYLEKPPIVLLPTCQILVKLIRNAVTGEARFQQVKLTNKKIQQHVVNVAGALDVLGVAGFVKQGPSALQFQASPESTPVVDLLCKALDTKIEELQLYQSKNASQSPTFLSEEERKKRVLKAKAAKKAKEEARKLEQQRWEEDKEKRLEAARRKEAAAARALLQAPPVEELREGLVIRQLPGTVSPSILARANDGVTQSDLSYTNFTLATAPVELTTL